MNFSVSIIVPAKNECHNIKNLVDALPVFPGMSEVIFVDGHSDDGTLEEIQRWAHHREGSHVVRWTVQDGAGKADAVWKGFNLARGDILMILDADLTVSPGDLLHFYEAVMSNPGALINGTRLVLPMEMGAMRPLNYWGNKVFAWLFRMIGSARLTDSLCGTKVISRHNYRRIQDIQFFRQLDDPFGDFTLLLGAIALKMPIIEVAVRYRSRRYGSTKISRFRDGWKLLNIMLAYVRVRFRGQLVS